MEVRQIAYGSLNSFATGTAVFWNGLYIIHVLIAGSRSLDACALYPVPCSSHVANFEGQVKGTTFFVLLGFSLPHYRKLSVMLFSTDHPVMHALAAASHASIRRLLR